MRPLELPSLLCPLVLHRGSGWNHRLPAFDSLHFGCPQRIPSRPPANHGRHSEWGIASQGVATSSESRRTGHGGNNPSPNSASATACQEPVPFTSTGWPGCPDCHPPGIRLFAMAAPKDPSYATDHSGPAYTEIRSVACLARCTASLLVKVAFMTGRFRPHFWMRGASSFAFSA